LVVELVGTAGRVVFAGVERRVQMDLVPEVQQGDWVLVHAGFAIQRMDADEAKETLALFAQIEASMPESGGPQGEP
jgi:hydrogenase expression/formation protein HypC